MGVVQPLPIAQFVARENVNETDISALRKDGQVLLDGRSESVQRQFLRIFNKYHRVRNLIGCKLHVSASSEFQEGYLHTPMTSDENSYLTPLKVKFSFRTGSDASAPTEPRGEQGMALRAKLGLPISTRTASTRDPSQPTVR